MVEFWVKFLYMDSNNNTICINNQLISEGHAYVYEGGKKENINRSEQWLDKHKQKY